MKKRIFRTFLQDFIIVSLFFGMISLIICNQRENILGIYVEGGSSCYTSRELDNAYDTIVTYFEKSKNEKIIEIIYSGDSKSKEMEETSNQSNVALFTITFETNQKNPKSYDSYCQILLCQNEQKEWQIVDTF